MKNKKMVATLASLCLIVVAVVAAVVGVLAAVNQSVQSTFNVSYFAKNVNATVTLKSIGPDADATDYEDSFTTAASGSTDTFLPLEGTRTASLTGKSYAFSWDDDEEHFLGKAIYQFEFHNNNAANGHALRVTPTFDKATLESTYNLKVLTFTSSLATLSAEKVRAEWVEETGALNTAEGHTFALTSDVASSYDAWTSAAFDVTANSSTYFYLIVAVANATQSQASLNLGGLISFALTDPTVAS